ncbi:MAG: hypothetical protein GY765_05760 [bacterium]|nr:hypothetical protein [bacterium]
MKRIIGLMLMLLVFVGCSSPGKKYFQLHMGVDESLPVFPDKTIMVSSVDVEPIYNDYRLVYRLSSYELNYYSYKFWIKRPGPLVRDAVCDFFKKNKIFPSVIRRFAEGDPQLVLKARVNSIEEYDYLATWYANMDVDIEIRDIKSGKVVLFYNFARRKMLPEKKADRLPEAFSRILEEELANVVKKLKLKLKQVEIKES